MREYYEKVFPEIKKSREDKERFSRYIFNSTISTNIFCLGKSVFVVHQIERLAL